MKLVMTLFVRNEEDILETNLRFHLERGVDLVIATDNLSEDGTPEILAEHARAGHLHHLRHTEDDYAQPEAMTRMARTAAEELGADWVIHNDADEFWWPHEGGLKEAFSAVPTRYGAVAAYRTNFVPRPEDGRTFPDRLDVVELPDIERLRDRDARREYGMRHFLVPKLAHRAVPEVEVLDASHGVAGPGLETAPGWRPVEILHYPFAPTGSSKRRCATEGGRSSATPIPTSTRTCAGCTGSTRRAGWPITTPPRYATTARWRAGSPGVACSATAVSRPTWRARIRVRCPAPTYPPAPRARRPSRSTSTGWSRSASTA
jgi:hypothetical protein